MPLKLECSPRFGPNFCWIPTRMRARTSICAWSRHGNDIQSRGSLCWVDG